MSEVRTEDANFLTYAVEQVCMAAGMSEVHAAYVADAIVFAHRQGKLNQGLGVYEALDIALNAQVFDVKATPELVNEGPAFAVFDGKGSSGYYTLNLMADAAIEKANKLGIAIAFGANHNDGGSFARYVYKAYEAGMVGIASNNTVPLAAPYGGMENKLSCPPFDAIVPSGSEPPIWASLKFAEWYDADISEAVLNNQPMKGQWLIDPETGELSDDAAKYARPIEGYGRVWDSRAAGQLETTRTYALNLWNEAMTAIINPLGVPSTEMPPIEEYTAGRGRPTVGGSYFMAINPAVFGPMAAMLARSDEFVRDVRSVKPRPGQTVRLPGEQGYQSLSQHQTTVDVLESHWSPFFETIAGRYGLSEEKLRTSFAQQPLR